jgi:hypothetical protein
MYEGSKTKADEVKSSDLTSSFFFEEERKRLLIWS